MHAGIQVAESDITITEGSTRQIFVRRQNRDSSKTLTVFVTTIEGYRQQRTQCIIDLPTLLNGRNESQIDPAEGMHIIQSYFVTSSLGALIYKTRKCFSIVQIDVAKLLGAYIPGPPSATLHLGSHN